MPKDIFISYFRRDQEFVTRLASDLDAQVAGVWLDQSTIQLGQNLLFVLAVRHIHRLEAGITLGQGWRVSAGWGCGAVVAAAVMIFQVGILTSVLGL